MTGRNEFLRALLGACVLLTVFVAWLATGFGSPWVARVVSDVSFIVLPSLAGVACMRAARRGGPPAQAWLLLGIAAFTWAMGGVAWAFQELIVRRLSPFPSVADIGFLGCSLPAAAALFRFPAGVSRPVARFRAFLDAAAIAASILFVSWAGVLGPVYRAGGEGLVARVGAISYPVVDVLMASLVLALGMRRGVGSRLPWFLLGGGLLTLAATDSIYVYRVVSGGYHPGTILDAGWAAAFLLIALATVAPSKLSKLEDSAPPAGIRRLTLAQESVPYVCLMVAVIVAAGTRVDLHDPFLVASGLVVLVVFALRQVVMLVESTSLADDLERKVETRTAALASQEHWFRSLVQNSSDLIFVVSGESRIRYRSPAVETILGYPQDEPLHIFDDLLRPEDRAAARALMDELAKGPATSTSMDFALRRRDGDWRQMETVATRLVHRDDGDGVVLNMRDVTERKGLEEKLTRQAFYDSLTGLPNRALFRDRLAHALEVARRRGAAPCVMVIDLDGFKEVNDTLGHSAGDRLLEETADRISRRLRPKDTAARLGGDEFALLLEETSRSGAEALASRIVAACRQPLMLEDREILPYVSIGITAWSADMPDVEAVMKNADAAMYAAKTAGGNRAEVYEAGTHAQVLGRFELAADLRGCVNRGELSLHYQPIVVTRTQEIVGLEALVRWQHPVRGLIPPDQFIPVAEQTGAILSVGRWVLETACRQAVEWQQRHPRHPPLYVSVNLSARQLREVSLAAEVRHVLSDTGLDPSSLVLEITETSLVSDFDETVESLHRLKDLGVKLSMDDFGTGYSSLTYLRNLPVDVVKIDRSFVNGIATAPDEWALAVAIFRLVRSISVDIVAEGVEGAAQLAHLRALGCDMAQGYYFARPQKPEAIEEMLAARQTAGHLKPAG